MRSYSLVPLPLGSNRTLSSPPPKTVCILYCQSALIGDTGPQGTLPPDVIFPTELFSSPQVTSKLGTDVKLKAGQGKSDVVQ